MNSLLNETLGLLGTLLSSVFNIFTSLLVWVWSVLSIIHNDFPRTEGLVIGILFAWFLIHRDKHPYIKLLAAPLKIILDTFDIIITETREAIGDLIGDTREKLSSLKDRVFSVLSLGYQKTLSGLSSLKDLVSKKIRGGKKEE